MRRPPLRLAALAAALLLALALSLPGPALATSCVVPELPSSTERAEVIFVGTVGAERLSGGLSTFAFRVERVHKGVVPAAVEVQGGGMKGAMFERGKRYLVFASLRDPGDGSPPVLFAHLCGGTQLATEGAAWLSALGPGTAPARPGTAVSAGAPPPRPTSAAPSAPTAALPTPTPTLLTPPTPTPTTSPSEQATTPSAAPTPPAAPAPEPPPPSAAPRDGGCSGCATREDTGDARGSAWVALGAVLAALRRRRGPTGARTASG